MSLLISNQFSPTSFDDTHYPLPPIKKKIIYLDQLVISNLMKAIHPTILGDRKYKIDPYWFSLFERLHSLVKIQLIICPDSQLHTDESILTSFNDELKSMYEQLSSGVSFNDPDNIMIYQIIDYANHWITNNNQYKPSFERSSVVVGNIDEWNSKLLVTINSNTLLQTIDDQRQYLKSSFNNIAQLFKHWQKETDKDFNYWYREEVTSFGINIVKSYTRYLSRLSSIQKGETEYTFNDVFPPNSALIFHQLKQTFRKYINEKDLVDKKIIEFLFNADHSQIPVNKIASLLWASVARKASAGQKRLPNRGMAIDIDAISTFMPYCDAMFVDKECHTFLTEEPLNSELNYNTKIFSVNNKVEFCEYLDSIRKNTSKEHFKIVNDVYGTDWDKSFVEMYNIKNNH